MEDPREIAAASAFRRVSDLIREADQMDPTNPTTIHMVIMDGDGYWDFWLGPVYNDSGLVRKYSQLKAEISLRTGRSVNDVLRNHPSLLLPSEQELRSDDASHKLHAGGVPVIDTKFEITASVGVAGAGRGLDCLCAKLGASEYLSVRKRLAESKAA
ncbi:MAG: hypothetical protein QG636_175 [Patescibacteria group bacterium]|jgi:hypothetical protein|nr:hypothetical protein [Patescibacteria group bacterium]